MTNRLLLPRAVAKNVSIATKLVCTPSISSKRCYSSPEDHISEKQHKELPDYNTSVKVHEHRLTKPTKPPPKPATWEGLKDLETRTKGSLIPETLKEMEKDETFKITLKLLMEKGQRALTKEEKKQRQRALNLLGVPDFQEFWRLQKKMKLIQDDENVLKKRTIEILQLNIGLYCNQACNHCHVESSPKRKETMSHEVAAKSLEVLANSPTVHTLDITGGAPELNQEFRFVAKGGRDLNKTVIHRCNLTSLLEPGQEDTPQFLAKNGIDVVASLPCYSSKNVNMQRGSGVFDKSIQALLILNKLGYGQPDSGLVLDLVYNPLGGYLPPPQEELAQQYKKEMSETFGIVFNRLFTMTNMPIKRFNDFLHRRNELKDYLALLIRNYNLSTVDNLMCRNLLSVNWNGSLHDCDFNQQLAIGMENVNRKDADLNIFDVTSVDDVVGNDIKTDNHCFGCTAGMGSS